MTLRIANCELPIEELVHHRAIRPVRNSRSAISLHSPLTTYHAPLTLPRGWSLLEVMIAMTVMGILFALATPSFERSLQQSRADIAGANLRAIWSAERLYWLEYRTYAADLSTLESLGLVDPTIVSATTVYVYAIQSAGSNAFTAAATRTGSGRWSGEFAIDEAGAVSGVLQATGEADIAPGFQ
jgi:prepilin-type N-terminal cleavage/methylation domain-containing protein